jgi:soluble lytic murein transglycosylase-like protein
MFTGSAKERIQTRLTRGTQYEPMIRAKMREGGIPEDMYYLALIESGFDPNAYSRAAAVGMWQFMTSTGRDMGLRIDWWVDERRDPFKSTTAAVRFIKGLSISRPPRTTVARAECHAGSRDMPMISRARAATISFSRWRTRTTSGTRRANMCRS